MLNYGCTSRALFASTAGKKRQRVDCSASRARPLLRELVT